MTPTALHELVRDVPEVIPTSLEFVDGMLWLYRDHKGIVAEISTEHAADLILAGVVRKLLSLGSIESYYGATDLIVVEVEGADELWAQGTGPTLLSAALAAYRKVKP
jgi:hypothetical protein